MPPNSDLVHNLETTDSPDRFKRIYFLLTLVCLFLIMTTSFIVISRQNVSNLLENTGYNSEKIAQALFASESDLIRIKTIDGIRTLSLDIATIPVLDENIRQFLQPFSVVKMKIYNMDKRIIYCTERSLIGKADRNNQLLANAINGSRQTIIKNRQSLSDLAEERRLEIDVAEVYVPLRDEQGQIAGVFELYSDISELKNSYKKQLIFSLATLFSALLLLSLASYMVISREASALQTAYQLLETLATRDTLTGIFNRRQLLARAAELYSMINRSREKVTTGIGLGVLMVDVDYFKMVNDTHGHLAGDRILHDFTRRIETVLRPYDVFGRYGGEEFMLFLPNISSDEARQISLRVLNVVSTPPYDTGSQSVSVTASIGCTWTNGGEESLDNILIRVDNLLYEAKRNGRNQVFCKF